MKTNSLNFCLLLAVAWSAVQVRESFAAEPGAKRSFVFGNVAYFHRWSHKDQHEFTPEDQEDLTRWSDMLTINGYAGVEDGEELAAAADAVLGNYKKHQARVLKTRSIPRAADRPAEHFIAVLFTRENFSEVAFARFKLMEGKGCSLVYSHRIYGEKTADAMSAWISANGPEVEKTLLECSSIPSPTLLHSEQL